VIEGSRNLLYEAANLMLSRYKNQLKLKDWAFRDRQAINNVQGAHRAGASPRHLVHAMLRNQTDFAPA
jgi:hypothetical protein